MAELAASARRRFAIRFGTHEPTNVGFTTQLERRTLAISTRILPTLGTEVHMELVLGDAGICHAEGQIAWTHKGVGTAGTIGVQLTRADPKYFELVGDADPELPVRTV